MSLPKFVIMKSNVSGKYLCYGKEKGSTPSSLTFSHAMNRPNLDAAVKGLQSLKKMKDESHKFEFHLLKFEVQEAKNAPGLVHIRTSYNNKYLVRKSEDSKNIVAESHEAEEDQSKWSCTLFKPIVLGDIEDDGEESGGCFGNKHGIGMIPQKIQLMHVVSQDFVYVDIDTQSIMLSSDATTLTVSDVEPTALLPVYLALRGQDGNYLGTPNGADLWFWYSDIGTPGVTMATWNTPSSPTWVILEPRNYDTCYWKVNQNDDMGLSSYGYTWLSPIKVKNHVVLYATDNNMFVHRNPGTGGISADSPTVIEEAKLEVVEPLLSRTILSITYDLDNARVYGTTNVTKITDSRSNYTDQEETGSLTREFTMSRTMTWNQSLTVSVGTSMSMSFGIPEVGIGGKVDLNFNISETCAWGEEKTQAEKISYTYNFDVPKHTKQTKTVVASKSSCDVPFTCEVEDVMTDGATRRYTKTDCWFTGANDYNADEETHNEPLSA